MVAGQPEQGRPSGAAHASSQVDNAALSVGYTTLAIQCRRKERHELATGNVVSPRPKYQVSAPQSGKGRGHQRAGTLGAARRRGPRYSASSGHRVPGRTDGTSGSVGGGTRCLGGRLGP